MDTQNTKDKLVITRVFEAPRAEVFDAFAIAEALAQWWGPPGVPITVVRFDFKPGGIFHYKATMNGQTVFGRFIYKQITSPSLLEFISSFSDETGAVIRAPFSNQFPLEIFNRLEFADDGDKTTITLTGYPVNATEEEIQMFISATAGMQQGFAGTFSQLDAYLAKDTNK